MKIKTFRGGLIDVSAPTTNDINLRDIIWPLCKIVRFGGHIRNRQTGHKPVEPLHYSVAEHSILIARKIMVDYPANPMLAMQALMHDATEAYIGDIVKPVKEAPALNTAFKKIENRLEKVIFAKCEIAYPVDPVIKQYDTRILMDEQSQALNPGAGDFNTGEPLGITLQFWSPSQAYEEFANLYGKLKYEINQETKRAA